MTTTEALITVLALALGTVVTRALPFILFPPGKPTPIYISYLGRVLPYATIGFLIIYCIKATSLLKYPYGLPELISIILVAAIQWFSKNALAAIIAGTVCYMALVQAVF